MKYRGFTLVELLVVIAVIALLAAIIFPAFASARGKARQAVCISNMRQIGMAVAMYAQDADDLYPNAKDSSDKYSTPWIWRPASPSDQARVASMPLINSDPHDLKDPGVLTPYVKSKEVWHCPSDTGYTDLDNAPFSTMNAHPTSYEAYGSSYLIRTEVALSRKLYSAVSAYQGCTELGPTQVNLMMDAYGGWHGGMLEMNKRYDVLMADGHVANQNRDQYWNTWHYALSPLPACAGSTP